MEEIIRAENPRDVPLALKRSRGTPTEKCALKRYCYGEDLPFVRLPSPPAPVSLPGSFVMCPVFCLQGAWQQALYQWAFAQAREVAKPSLPERDLLAVWN